MPTSRARSFGAVAAAYAEHRPGYPAAALDWALAPLAGSGSGERTLLDLGAGTGKLTSALLGRGTVIAVEPDPAMLTELRRRLPDVDALAGSAESIPLPAGSVDTVLVGQAWHWFDTGRALPELARVLRPGGVLAALWNADDHDVEWVAELHRAARAGRAVSGVENSGVPPVFAEHDAFAPGEFARFANPIRTGTEQLLATLATHSWALVSEPGDRDAAFARIRAYLAERPETSSGDFVLPMSTEVLRALRR
jgi:SAM-dependent methyltransferase